MTKPLGLVVLLATTVISTSDVLPKLSINQEIKSLYINGQPHDNTFSNNDQSRKTENNICKITTMNQLTNQFLWEMCKMLQKKGDSTDNNKAEPNTNDNVVRSNFDYNDQWRNQLRKDHWDNYPRQMDRLQRYLYKQSNPNPDPNNIVVSPRIYGLLDDYMIGDNNMHGAYDTVVLADNPLMALKKHLTSLNKNGVQLYPFITTDLDKSLGLADENEIELLVNDDDNNTLKVKRDYETNRENSKYLNSMATYQIPNKRIFSLWSRIQNLSPKGHELQHRRHLYKYYGFPQNDASNAGLTAETRAVIRPPGAPLRWG